MGEAKQRKTFTFQDDIAVVRAVLDGDGGAYALSSAGLSKAQWVSLAERLCTMGVDITWDGLKRRVIALTKKHRARGPEDEAPRMRWGIVWPKSEEELELESLLDGLCTKFNQKTDTNVRPKVQAEVVSPGSTADVRRLGPSPPTDPEDAVRSTAQATSNIAPRVHPVALSSQSNQVHAVRESSYTQREQGASSLSNRPARVSIVKETVAVRDSGVKRLKLAKQRNVTSDHHSTSIADPHTTRATDNTYQTQKLQLLRRRVELEEQNQKRIMEVQANQIELQREQLRLQSEVLRALLESTQAISRALQ